MFPQAFVPFIQSVNVQCYACECTIPASIREWLFTHIGCTVTFSPLGQISNSNSLRSIMSSHIHWMYPNYNFCNPTRAKARKHLCGLVCVCVWVGLCACVNQTPPWCIGTRLLMSYANAGKETPTTRPVEYRQKQHDPPESSYQRDTQGDTQGHT